MYTEQLFMAHAARCRDAIQAVMPRWYRGLQTLEQEFAYGYAMYTNARQGALGMMILGDESIRGEKELLENMGVTSVTPAGAAKVIQGALADQRQTRGAVLNELYWWPFFNDCWVLGGVHGKMEFHLAFDGWPADDQLWDAKNSRPKMLGRELLILSAAGYSRRTAGGMGTVLYNTDHMKAFNLWLPTIYGLAAGGDSGAFISRIKAAF